MTLGDIIKDFRSQNGMNVEDFSRRSGLSTPMIYKLEANKMSNGKIPNPSRTTALKVSKVVGMTIEEIEKATDKLYKDVYTEEEKLLNNKKYNRNTLDKYALITIRLPREKRDRVKKMADEKGLSMNAMILGLIDSELD